MFKGMKSLMKALPVIFFAVAIALLPQTVEAQTSTHPTFSFTNIHNVTGVEPWGVSTNSTHFFVTNNTDDRDTVAIYEQDSDVPSVIITDENTNRFLSDPFAITVNGTHFFVAANTNGLVIFEHGSSSPTIQKPNLKRIFDLAINPTHLFVPDDSNDRLNALSLDTGELSLFSDEHLANAFGIATNSTHVFVNNAISNTVGVATVKIFTLAGALVDTISGIGSPGGLDTQDSFLFVTDSGYNEIKIYSQHDSSHIQTLTHHFNSPTDVAVNGEYLYVADRANSQVQVFEYSVTCPAASRMLTEDNVCVLTQAAIDLTCPDGEVKIDYICESEISEDDCSDTQQVVNNMCQELVCSPGQYAANHICQGEELTVTEAADPIDITSPQYIATNSTHIFVLDLSGTLSVFSQSDGTEEYTVGGLSLPTGIATNSTHVFASNSVFFNQGIKAISQSSHMLTDFSSDVTTGLAANSAHLFAAVPAGNTINIYEHAEGTLADTIPSTSPTDVALNSTHLFVTSESGNTLSIFSLADKAAEPVISNFDSPNGVGTSDELIFVADKGNDQVQIFRQSDGLNLKNVTGFNSVNDVATNSTHFFATDGTDDQIRVFEYSFGCSDSGEFTLDDNCEVDVSSCEDDEELQNGTCVKLICDAGEVAENNACVPRTIDHCEIDERLNDDNQCIIFNCDIGEIILDHECVDVTPPADPTPEPEPTPKPRSTGGGGNSGKAPDSRVCGGVLCSEVVNVPVELACDAGTHKVNGICVPERQAETSEDVDRSETMLEPQAGYISEPTEEPEHISEPTEEPEHISEPTEEPEHISEPTEEPQLTPESVPTNPTTEPDHKVNPEASETRTNQDIFTKFYNWLASVFG